MKTVENKIHKKKGTKGEETACRGKAKRTWHGIEKRTNLGGRSVWVDNGC